MIARSESMYSKSNGASHQRRYRSIQIRHVVRRRTGHDGRAIGLIELPLIELLGEAAVLIGFGGELTDLACSKLRP